MRVCAWCNLEILNPRRKYYCSKDCHQAAQDHIYWDRRPFKATERHVYPRVCEYCHNDFLSDRQNPRQGRGRFCSVKCASASRQDHSHRTCAVCGVRFQPPKVKGHRGRSTRKTCSLTCQGKLNRSSSEYVLAFGNRDYNAMLTRLRTDTVPQRVSEYVDDDCWVWQGTRDIDGYAVGPKALRQTLIRAIVELRYGAPLGSQHAHHTCGCGAQGCVRPSHLVPATQAANVAEMRCRTALENRVKELTAALREHAPDHALLQQIPVVWT